MAATPFSVGKHFSDLLGRPVQASRADDPSFTPRKVYALYDVQPGASIVVAQLDLNLLATLAGILIALPPKQVEQEIAKPTLGDDMLDASREVMNIFAAAIIDEGRAVFRRLCWKLAELPVEAQKLLGTGPSALRESLRLTVSGQPAGFLTIATAL